MTETPRAADLPVGSKVIHNGDTITRDRPGIDGWWGPPQGYYMDHEVDRFLDDGAEVLRVGAATLVCGCGVAPDGAPGAVGCSPSCMTPCPEPDDNEESRP